MTTITDKKFAIQTKLFQQEHAEMHEINEVAVKVAEEAQDLFRTALSEFETTKITMINNHRSEIKKRDTSLKILSVAFIIAMGCVVYLSVRIIQNKC